VMCDRGGCPKVYHLHCLKLSKPPHGKCSFFFGHIFKYFNFTSNKKFDWFI
jgi:hypothetical protein